MPTGWFIVQPPVTSTAAVALKKAAPALTGGIGYDGSIAPIALSKTRVQMLGYMRPDGPMAVALKKLTVSMNAQQGMSGGLAVTLPKLSTDFEQDLFTGAMFSTLKPVKLAAALETQGQIATQLATVDAAFAATQQYTGALAARLKVATAIMTGSHSQDGVLAAAAKKVVPTGLGATSMSVSTTLTGTTFDTNFFGQNWNLGVKLVGGLLRSNDRGGAADFGRVMYRNGITVKTAMTTPSYYIEATCSGAAGDDRGILLYVGLDSSTAMTKWVGVAIYGQGNLYICRSANRETALSTAVAANMASGSKYRLLVRTSGANYIYEVFQDGVLRTSWTDTNGAVYGTPGPYAAIGSSCICQGFGNYISPNSWQGTVTVGEL